MALKLTEFFFFLSIHRDLRGRGWQTCLT